MDHTVELWNSDLNIPTTLRQPNAISNNAGNTRKNQLSANAKEFVPRNYNAPPAVQSAPLVVQSVQNRLKVHKQKPEPEPPCSSAEMDMQRLQQIVNTLTGDPGQFDDLLQIFMETLQPYLNDLMILHDCARLLFNQAVNYPNFRYSGARLCSFVQEYCPEFRAGLHLLCTKELEDNPNKQNVLLFIAEIYTQLQDQSIYGTLLVESFRKLLKGQDNVKCICQALKLTGYSLEKDNKAAVDELFVELESIKATLSGSTLSLLEAVINLRQNNWGHIPQTDTSTTSGSEDDLDAYYSEPQNAVFYDANGEQYSSEESEFLAAHMNSNEEFIFDDGEDPDELCDPEPEMTEEIQAAFKEFVKLSKR